MNKLIIALGIAIFAGFKVAENLIGGGDGLTIVFISFIMIAWLSYAFLAKRFSLTEIAVLSFPLLVILGLVLARYLSLVASPNWVIWSVGLFLGILCIASFEQLRMRPRASE